MGEKPGYYPFASPISPRCLLIRKLLAVSCVTLPFLLNFKGEKIGSAYGMRGMSALVCCRCQEVLERTA